MNNKRHSLLLPLSAVLILGLVIFFLINHTAVIDTFKGLGYNPTPDMLTVKASLGLTGEGNRIFNATRPLLASREDFNASCESHDSEVSVLGCYTGDRVYVYNVEDPKLPGIRESTSAHELLHAIWNRLSGLEKSELIPTLEQVYSANESSLKDTIESYADSERLDELYVRIGTQIASLPDSLEKHYAKYFTDQDLIVSYYNSYITPFNQLKEQIAKLKQELDTLEKEISTRSAALDARVSAFDSAVAEFNNCANTAGCFNIWTFSSRRTELVAEQQSLNAENSALNALIDSYNKKADTYNSSIAHSADLQNLINSNSPVNSLDEE